MPDVRFTPGTNTAVKIPRSDVWFELGTDDLIAARSQWIRDPSGTVHLLVARGTP